MANDTPAPETAELVQRWTQLMTRSSAVLQQMWAKGEAAPNFGVDPFGLMGLWTQLAGAALSDPSRLAALQTDYVKAMTELWQELGRAARGEGAEPAPVTDKRFSGAAWSEQPLFDLIRRSYLLTAEHVLKATGALAENDPATQAKAMFHARQFVDAMSPSNFALTNPDVLKRISDSRGANLLAGFEHMLDDLARGRMRMTDEAAFEVGRNVAATPGKVVFENRLFQLIQYTPTTGTVFAVPLLFLPSWINKYYILDLTPEKSFVRWMVDAGFTVFIVSWKSADESITDVTIDSYVGEGQLTAIGKAIEAARSSAVHTVGYCVSGTTLAATLALLHAKGHADMIRSATFLAAQVDFTEAGDLSLLVDDEMIARAGQGRGYFDGRAMATTFNLLRSNDLIWSYVVNNYLMGKDYFPFDLLYWNSDSTHIPAGWHANYLRDMYRDNLLVKPGGITVAGTPIDLGKVTTPSYIQSGREDHIAPARSVYKMVRSFAGPVRFMLAGSGHIAGVINPPATRKYQYWTADPLPPTLDEFLATADEIKGSWWPDWLKWLTPLSGEQVPARVPGDGPLKIIDDAPGRYVKERI